MVKIRLARRGRKKLAMFDIVVSDSRAPRDGRFIEKIGTYDPTKHPASVFINDDRAFQWLMKGARPTDSVGRMLSGRGVMLRKHLQIGVVKGALTQDQADSKLADWKKAKETNIRSKTEAVTKAKVDAGKARFEAERKVKEAREAARARRAQEAAKAAAEAPAPSAETSESNG